MKTCLKKALTAIGIIKALVSRTLFAAHGFVCIWRVVVVKDNPLFWCLTASLPLLVFEAIFTVKKKKGGEWKWYPGVHRMRSFQVRIGTTLMFIYRICPSVFLYLGITVPAIWFLELDLLEKRLHGRHSNNLDTRKKVHGTVLPGQIEIPIFLKPDDWCKILEQMLLLILIIGRWLLPKGEITREQLSQLLLVYIGMAADIIELFEAFKEKQVRNNRILTLTIMSLWTASLLQFTFVLTATKSKTTRPVLTRSKSSASTRSTAGGRRCCPTEAISIIVSVFLQDGPFLVLRMMLIFRFRVLSYTNLFFTLKNSLVITLQFYRLLILFCQKQDRDPLVMGEDFDKNASLISDEKNGVPKSAFENGKSRTMSLNYAKGGSFGRKDSVLRRQYSVCSTSQQSPDVEFKHCGKSSNESIKSLEQSDIDEESYIIQRALDNCLLKLKNANQSIGTGALVGGIDDVSRKHVSFDDGMPESFGLMDVAQQPKMAAPENKEMKSGKEERIGKGKGKSKGKKKKVKSHEAEGHWDEVKKLASAIAFINETEKYRSFLLHEQKQNGGPYAYDDQKTGYKSGKLEDSGG
ncbi:uncharacterized protein LOC121389839 [Gigantopelta aegis]|uniref:uncharacterized protein LOC121389839 n=1 Tax=Gigantopelta aegis TaxID=1735272 RepID=UPI001B88DA1B|nr:uncharacterized protein LOC121389839 [Gigantopelta aegis]